jgi:hypothetical protein
VVVLLLLLMRRAGNTTSSRATSLRKKEQVLLQSDIGRALSNRFYCKAISVAHSVTSLALSRQ